MLDDKYLKFLQTLKDWSEGKLQREINLDAKLIGEMVDVIFNNERLIIRLANHAKAFDQWIIAARELCQDEGGGDKLDDFIIDLSEEETLAKGE